MLCHLNHQKQPMISPSSSNKYSEDMFNQILQLSQCKDDAGKHHTLCTYVLQHPHWHLHLRTNSKMFCDHCSSCNYDIARYNWHRPAPLFVVFLIILQLLCVSHGGSHHRFDELHWPRKGCQQEGYSTNVAMMLAWTYYWNEVSHYYGPFLE